jgi:hypothetical protein
MTRSSSAVALTLAVAMGWISPASAQNAPVMIPMMMAPVTLVPVIMVQPVMVQPVVVQPVVVMQPAPAQPVAAVPVVAVAPPAEPEGNMLSRLIAKIEVKTDNEIRNGPEGPMDQVNYRPPPEPPQMIAVPVVMVPAAQGVYTVRSGGSLAAVAVRTGATLDALIALNPSLPSNRRLEAGTMVNLPFPWQQQ